MVDIKRAVFLLALISGLLFVFDGIFHFANSLYVMSQSPPSGGGIMFIVIIPVSLTLLGISIMLIGTQTASGEPKRRFYAGLSLLIILIVSLLLGWASALIIPSHVILNETPWLLAVILYGPFILGVAIGLLAGIVSMWSARRYRASRRRAGQHRAH